MGTVDVSLLPPEADPLLGSFDILYDLNNDGQEFDNATATTYTGPIRLTATTVVRARVINTLTLLQSKVATWTYTRNNPPSVNVTFPAGGQILRQGHAYTLTASATDPDSNPLTVTYAYRVGTSGPWSAIGSSQAATGYGVTWTPPSTTSTHQVRATAADVHGASDSHIVVINITLPNEPPMVTLTAPSAGAVFIQGQTVQMTATANDQDAQGGGITRVEFYRGTQLIANDNTSPYSASFPADAVGPLTLQAKAFDNHPVAAEGSSSPVAIVVNAPNRNPAISTFTVTPPGPYTAPAALTLNVAAADPDGVVDSVVFFGGANRIGRTLGPGPNFTYGLVDVWAGEHTFTARAFDNSGGTSELARVTITVNPNQRPVANAGRDTSLTLPANTVRLNGGRSSDPEGGALTYHWTPSPGASLTNATTATPTATFNGSRGFWFTMVVTDPVGLKDTDWVDVAVYSRPALTSRLQDTATVGVAYTYNPAATGFEAPAYTVSARPPWLNLLSNPTRLSGTPPVGSGGMTTLTITATNNVGSDSKTLNLFIREAPRITQNLPDSINPPPLEGDRLTLTVAAEGTPPPTYQWQKMNANGSATNIAGATSPTYAIDALSLSHSGSYRVAVSTNGIPVLSRQCRVDVKQRIRIGTQPARADVMVGQRVTLSVNATGAPPLRYQWFKDTTRISGPSAGDTVLVLDSVKLSHAGLYRALVTNPYSDPARPGTLEWSDTARVQVTLPKIDRIKADPGSPKDYGRDGPTLTVRLYTDTPATTIRYTTDGSDPTESTGHLYDSAAKIILDRISVTLKARAYRDGFQPSDPFTGAYTYAEPSRATRPTAHPAQSTFGPSPILCTLTTTPSDATIRYTLDGTDPRVGGKDYVAPFPISASTTVIAYALAADHFDSDTLVKRYILEKPLTPAQAPQAVPPGGAFTESISVTLRSHTDGAAIHYTTDGSPPDESPTRQTWTGTPIRIDRTTVLKAVAIRDGYLTSAVSGYAFTRRPGPITATPTPVNGNHIFEDQVLISLEASPSAARIYFTTNDSTPLDGQNRPKAGARLYAPPGILLDSSCTIKAMAIEDSVPSELFAFPFTRKGGLLAPPLVETPGNSYEFKDSLQVTLRSTGEIRFTLDGSLPSRDSKPYKGPFHVDTTTTLHAIAFHPDFQPSRIMIAGFTLMPDTPRAEPPGGDYPDPQKVVLSATSRKTPIRYTLDGSDPGPDHGELYTPGKVILIDAPIVLKAVALSGGLPGPSLVATYNIFGSRDTVLQPGGTFHLVGGFSLSNPADQGAAVHVRQASADSLPVPGFRDLRYSLVLSRAPGTAAGGDFPRLVLSRPASETRGFYRIDPSGRVYFLSGAGTAAVNEPGTYFMARDVSPPVIRWLGESFDDSGYTEVRLKVEDNVQNLLFSAKRSDNPGLNVIDSSIFSGSELAIRLRHPPKVLKPLYLQVGVFDFHNTSYLPPGGIAFLPLSQRLAEVQGPAVWRIGGDPEAPHDLVGIPLALDPPLTLGDLGDGSIGKVEGFIWEEKDQRFRRLGQDETFLPGQAYWLATRSPLKAFHRGAARTTPLGSARFEVRLKHGWNQVTNPHLETLYWPFPRYLEEAYRSSLIKGLWAYSPETSGSFSKQDSLEPWRGYYVYNYRGDTTVELLTAPAGRPSRAKKASMTEARLGLSSERYGTVDLGASPTGHDEAGSDDEGLLPSMSGERRLKAIRQGRSLSSDWIRFAPAKVLQWRVLPPAWNPDSPRGGVGGQPALTVKDLSLPEGYEAWALSHFRKMKFRLEPGKSLPASGLAEDTLLVVTGPGAMLASWDFLEKFSEKAPALDLKVRMQADGPEFVLDLPNWSNVRATLWSLRGQRLGELHRTLPEGRYRFRYAADFRHTNPEPGPGVHFLRVEIRGEGTSASFSRKVVSKH